MVEKEEGLNLKDELKDNLKKDSQAAPTAQVKDGKLEFFWTGNENDEVTLFPQPPVMVKVDGEVFFKAIKIRLGQQVEVEIADEEPAFEMKLDISPDKMSASLTVIKKEGKAYVLKDKPPANFLELKAEVKETAPPLVPSLEEALKKIEEEGVKYGVSPDAVAGVLEAGGSAVIAEGKPPIAGEDARIVKMFKEEEIEGGSGKIGLISTKKITMVEPGALLAVKVPPTLGEDGVNVRGEAVKAQSGRDIALKAGNGAKVDPDGLKIYAAISGRPMLAGNVVMVFPRYEIESDLEPSAGNIRFGGDVVIAGSVLENMEVETGGQAEVGLNVFKSVIRAGGAVIIGRNVVSSEVQAGGIGVMTGEMLFHLKEIIEDFDTLNGMWEQVCGNNKLRDRLPSSGGGALCFKLIENKVSSLPDAVAKMAIRLKDLEVQLGEKWLDSWMDFAKELNPNYFLRLSFEEIDNFFNKRKEMLLELKGILEELAETDFDLTFSYAQYSTLKASGNIRVLGKGVYNSFCYAGGGVYIEGYPGVFRGGEIKAEGEVVINELGTEAEAITKVEVSEKGSIRAKKAYAGVLLKAGVRIVKLEEETRDLIFLP